MYIYKTTNLINGKIYIGLSEKSPEDSKEYLGSGDSMKRAISKYGVKNFSKEILEEGFSDKSSLVEAEIRWISHFNSTDRKIGYNLSPGGDLNPGHMKKVIYQYSLNGELIEIHPNIDSAKKKNNIRNSDLYKKKIREVKPIKGFWWSITELTKEEIEIRNRVYTETLKENHKNGAKKRYDDLEYRKGRKENMLKIRTMVKDYGKSQETRDKISEKIKGRRWYTNTLTGEQKQLIEPPDLKFWIRGRKNPGE
jgi:hypothetical protein